MPITINGSGTITGASTLATTVASPTFTTPNINSAQFATVSGTAPIYPCRAWVNFNGQGTVAIRASGNVSSITDNGTGDYTANFTTAMPDANYSTVSNMYTSDMSTAIVRFATTGYASSSVRLQCVLTAGGFVDPNIATVAIFR
jgi:hypothetical protein